MSFITSPHKPEVQGLKAASGAGSMWSHTKLGVATALYDLPIQNIERAVQLQHAGGSFYGKIGPEEATERFGIPGVLQFDEPISWKKADLIAQFKREELERMQLIQQGDTGAVRKLAFLGGNFAAEALDPINLAMMFIPAVGATKFAKLGVKHGVGKARVIAGAADAALGAALVEPLAYLSKSFGEQNEYGIKNTALNLTMSMALGIGLRVGGGKIKDKLTGDFNPRRVLEDLDAADGIKAINRVHIHALEVSVRKAYSRGLKPNTDKWTTYVTNQVSARLKDARVELDANVKAMADLGPKVRADAFTAAMNNLLYGEPLTGPRKVIEFDAMGRMDKQVTKVWKQVRSEIEANTTRVAEGKKPIPDTAESVIVETPVGTRNVQKSGGAEIEWTETEAFIEVVAPEYEGKPGSPKRLHRAALLKGKAQDAVAANKQIKVNGKLLTPDETKVLAGGRSAMHTPKPPPDPAQGRAEAYVEPEISEGHIDVTSRETIDVGRRRTAEEINAQAEVEMARIKELVGLVDQERVKKIAFRDEVDPVALARAAADDSTLLSRIEKGQISAEDAVAGKKGVDTVTAKPSDESLFTDPLADTAGAQNKKARRLAAKEKAAAIERRNAEAEASSEKMFEERKAREAKEAKADAKRKADFEKRKTSTPEEKAAFKARQEELRIKRQEITRRLQQADKDAQEAKWRAEIEAENAINKVEAERANAPDHIDRSATDDLDFADVFDSGPGKKGTPDADVDVDGTAGPVEPDMVEHLMSLLGEDAPDSLKQEITDNASAQGKLEGTLDGIRAGIDCSTKNV